MSAWAAKRFWTEAAVVAEAGGWTVRLDGRPVRTPAKAPLVVPTQAAAEMVAEEWRAQEERIDPTRMPATRMANAAIDKVAAARAEVVGMLAGYGETDLVSYRADGPEPLVARQAAAWDPLVDWAARTHGARLQVTRGILPIPQEREALERLRARIDAFDHFGLSGLHDLVALSGSLVIGLAVAEGHLDAADGWALSRIDETYQEEVWGPDDEAQAVAALRLAAFLFAKRFISALEA